MEPCHVFLLGSNCFNRLIYHLDLLQVLMQLMANTPSLVVELVNHVVVQQSIVTKSMVESGPSKDAYYIVLRKLEFSELRCKDLLFF